MRHTLNSLADALHGKRQTTPTDIRTAATVTHSTTTTATERSGGGVVTNRIDDPYGANTIVTISGTLSTAGLVHVTMAMNDVPHWWRVFIDLSATVIPDADAMDRLEAWIDLLEIRGYHLHVAGISPEHPALPTSPRRP